MTRYYFTVRYLPESANVNLLVGRCLFIMHGYICKQNIQGIGVSFPRWSDESIGNVIAFFYSDKDVLNVLSRQRFFNDMKECGFFSLSEVVEVPTDCPEVRFKRNQTIKKIFPAEKKRRLKRLEKRAQAQGKNFNPEKLTSVREFDLFHQVSVASVSKSVDVELFIQKELGVEYSESSFNSYGLATNDKHLGTVPDITKYL
ncbi:MAG: type I-F CRISPR-associated endoribonuclease Cas6/Csy4 [Thalassotalea sp.]|nr:type I-F CRISPR-associated endoribonuclease Cas6/Csy4 [Thalassotalea sp.]